MTAPVLSIVIPACNEAARIAQTVRTWSLEVHRLGIPHEILAYDDGSTDATPDRLATLAGEIEELRVTRHANRGHGPTILRGYREAHGDWVLQIDGDDEVGTAPFESFWTRRDQHDMILGTRTSRRLSLPRRLLTKGATLTVRLAVGAGISDVNSPYRLIRRSALSLVLPRLPDDTFAPNVAITAFAIRRRWRLLEQPVVSRRDAHRRPTSWSTLPVGWLVLRQLLAVARSPAAADRPASNQRNTR